MLFSGLEIGNEGFGATDAIGSGAHDSAGLSGPLAAGVEPRGRYSVAFSVSNNGDRRTRACLNTGEDGIGMVVATQFFAEQGDSQTKRLDDMLWQ